MNFMIAGIIILIAASLITALINSTVFFLLLGVAGLFIILYLCSKFRWARIGTLVVLVVATFCGGIYSGVNLDTYYNTKGGFFGRIGDFLGVGQVEVVDEMKFDFSNISLTKTEEEGDEYTTKIKSQNVLSLEGEKLYGVFVNGDPCSFVENGEDYICAEYSYVFKNQELSPILSDTLSFRFGFYPNGTEFTIKTTGGDSAVKLWNSYFKRYNFIVSLEEIDYKYDQGIGDVLDERLTAKFYIDDTHYLTQLYPSGSEVKFPTFYDDLFQGWKLKDQDEILDTYIITDNTEFYAERITLSQEEISNINDNVRGFNIGTVSGLKLAHYETGTLTLYFEGRDGYDRACLYELTLSLDREFTKDDIYKGLLNSSPVSMQYICAKEISPEIKKFEINGEVFSSDKVYLMATASYSSGSKQTTLEGNLLAFSEESIQKVTTEDVLEGRVSKSEGERTVLEKYKKIDQ